MKIAVLGPGWPWRGGIARFQSLMAQELATEHQIKIFSFKNQYPALIFPGKAQKDFTQPRPELVCDDVLTPYNPFSWLAAARKIAAWKPDILIISFWIPFFAPAFGWIARKLKSQTKIYYLAHNLDSHEKWPLAEKLTQYALQPTDKIITLSEEVYNFAQKKYPQKTIIKAFHPIYNCYDNNSYQRETVRKTLNLQDKQVLLFFGYIKPYKGLDLLLKAMPIILEQNPESHLLIVGEIYGEEKPYHDLINDLRISKNITFINEFVQEGEVEKYFKAADLLVLPYKTATQSGVAQIAYAMDLGVVCTPVGGLPEIVKDGKTGVVAATTKPADLAIAVTKFFELDYAYVKGQIREELAKYSWSEFTKKII